MRPGVRPPDGLGDLMGVTAGTPSPPPAARPRIPMFHVKHARCPMHTARSAAHRPRPVFLGSSFARSPSRRPAVRHEPAMPRGGVSRETFSSGEPREKVLRNDPNRAQPGFAERCSIALPSLATSIRPHACVGDARGPFSASGTSALLALLGPCRANHSQVFHVKHGGNRPVRRG